MALPPQFRAILIASATMGLLMALLLLLQILDVAISVWKRLAEASPWLPYVYMAVLFSALAAGGLMVRRIIRILFNTPTTSTPTLSPPSSAEEVAARISRNLEAGAHAEAEAVRLELLEIQARRQGGEFHVAVAGEVNAGKSALVAALIPDAFTTISPIAGATRTISRQVWRSAAGDRLVLADLPGLNEPGERLSQEAHAEATRAHVVLFVCDGDLTRDQLREVNTLLELGKPLIIVINKQDRLRADELALVRQRVQERLGTAAMAIVASSSGGQREVIRRFPNGEERLELQPIPPQVDEVQRALQQVIDSDRALLETLRDQAVFAMAARKLDLELLAQRRVRCAELTTVYARKAVVVAGASISPGMDVLFQGALGVAFVRELCAIHDAPVAALSLSDLLKQVELRGSRSLPLLLAVAGNGCKAFPGVGTLAGGALHAVAYGIIFNALGRAVAATLEERSELAVQPTMLRFETLLSEGLEEQAMEMLRTILHKKGAD